MMGTFIAVRGLANVGKTTSIRWAFERLTGEEHEHKEVRNFSLEIDGIKVGFTSVGDTPKVLEQNLRILLQAGCVVIVCATHTTQSRTVEVVTSLAASNGYDAVWIEKSREVDQDGANRQTAERIVAEVHKAIAGHLQVA